jgi:P4 family phage/plasmid primase-like protien
MVLKYQNLEDLLINNKCPKDKKHTHTRIPEKAEGNKKQKIFGGSYYLEDAVMPEFWHHYHKKVFINKKKEHLTEKQLTGDSVLAVDFDFRYNTDIKERQHTEEHITDIIGEISELLNKYLETKKGDKYKVFVFEKPNVNQLEDVTKDGIHVIFKVNMSVNLKHLLWDELLSHIEDCWGGENGLPVINSWETVLDKGVMNGGTNWQCFGSRKPYNEAYELKYIYMLEMEDEETLTINSLSIEGINYEKLLSNISVRNKDNVKFEMKEKTKELLVKYNKKVKKKKLKLKKFRNTNINRISTREKLLEECEKIINQKHKGEYKFSDIHNYVMILTEEYYNDYSKWLKIGFALKNTDNDLFMTWMYFSSQSEKFNFEEMSKWKEMWENDNFANGDLTEGTIRFYAKESNYEAYEKIKGQSIQNIIEKTIGEYADFNIANVLYHLYRENWKLASHDKKKWFQFRNHRWHEAEKGSALRLELSKTVSKIYFDQQHEILEKLQDDDDDGLDSSEHVSYQKRAAKYSEIGLKLRQTHHKNNIMVEAADLMYDDKFYKNLDSDANLICFTNGIIDIEQKKFRKGSGTDYVSMCTHIPYIKLDKEDKEQQVIIEEIKDFMRKLFPLVELRGYMWEHLASIVIGNNVNQTFNFYLGCGSNGKSMFIDLVEKCLGDYKGQAPLNMITGNRTKEGQATPEIIGLKGKRLAVLQEAKKKTIINEGPFKEYTGCDSISGRGLYQAGMITYKPQFNMVLMTNHLPEIKSNDNGTWRRVRVVDFMSRFEDNPNDPEFENEKYVFKKNKDLKKRFDDWAPVFMSMIVDIVFKTKGVIQDVDIVMQASKNYRNTLDYLTQFTSEFIIKAEGCWLQKMDIKEEFKQWYLENFGNDIPKNKELFEFLEKKYGSYNKKRGWKGIKLVMNPIDSDED